MSDVGNANNYSKPTYIAIFKIYIAIILYKHTKRNDKMSYIRQSHDASAQYIRPKSTKYRTKLKNLLCQTCIFSN